MAMLGIFYRSPDGISGFEASDVRLFPETMRHSTLLKRGDTLYVFWTRVGDAPEHILLTKVDISGDWSTWSPTDPISVLRQEEWEGADRPLLPSVRDAINVRVNQLRDPAIFQEDGRTYVLYSVAGEAGIGIAENVLKGEYFAIISTTTTKTELIWASTKKHQQNDLFRIGLLQRRSLSSCRVSADFIIDMNGAKLHERYPIQ
jgi:hypothetical protein